MHMSEHIEDQAMGLRRMVNPDPVRVIAVTGGKGGVGKTNISVNLGVAMAELGRRVMLLDADLGLANIDVVLGLHARRNLSHVMKGECSLEEIMVIERRCYRYPWTRLIFNDCLRAGYCCWVCERQGVVEGYGVTSVAAGESHLLNLCVRPESQQQGIGRKLLLHLISRK